MDAHVVGDGGCDVAEAAFRSPRLTFALCKRHFHRLSFSYGEVVASRDDGAPILFDSICATDVGAAACC